MDTLHNRPVDLSVHESVAVFDTAERLQAAVDELLGADFDHADVTMLAGESAIDLKLGHLYAKKPDAFEVAGAPRGGYVANEDVGNAKGGLIGGLIYIGALAAGGAIFTTGGTLALAIGAAVAAGGAGGLIGSVLAKWVGDSHARELQDQIDRGGLVLWVRARDVEHARRAKAILSRHSPYQVQVYPADRSAE